MPLQAVEELEELGEPVERLRPAQQPRLRAPHLEAVHQLREPGAQTPRAAVDSEEAVVAACS